MQHNLGLCPACGYKIFTADERLNTPQELRTLKKLALGQKFHFTSRPYESCPQCKHVFKSLETELHTWSESQTSKEDIASAFALITAGSTIIKSFRDSIKSVRTSADAIAKVKQSLINQIATADERIDLSVQLGALLSALELLQERTNELVTETTKATDEFTKRMNRK